MPPMRKRKLIPLLTGVAVAAIATVAWLNREAIVSDYVDDMLTEAGVAASYDIDRIGVREQRLRNVVIGNPANPDLVAREVDLTLGIGWTGPTLTALRARGVRLNARWTGERLTMGQIDKLLPKTDGTPFALPDIAVDIDDATARVVTPWGRVALDATGQGILADGFAGRIGFDAPRLALAGCQAEASDGLLSINIADGTPTLRGPAGIAALRCADGDVSLTDLRIGIDASSNDDFTTIRSRTGVRGGSSRIAGVESQGLTATVNVSGALQGELEADWQVTAARITQPWLSAKRFTLDGRGKRLASGALSADGRIALSGGRLGRKANQGLAGLTSLDDSTPLGPLARKFGTALRAAGSDFAVSSTFALAGRSVDTLTAVADSVRLIGANGARVAMSGDRAIRWSAQTGLAVAGTAEIGGGGLPEGSITLARAGTKASLSGEARFAPYVAGSAILAIDPLTFRAAPNGHTSFSTALAVSGPLAGGRVERLSVPIAGVLGSDGSVRIDGDCRVLRWQAITVSGTAFDPGGVRLCGTGSGPLLAWSGRGLSGGVTMPGFALAGRSGDSPLRITSAGGTIDLATLGFALRGVDASIGSGESATRFVAASLSGRSQSGEFAGEVRDGSGKIGPVPFLLSGANGRWALADGGLTLDASLIVDDAAEVDRFQRLSADAVSIRFADGIVRASGRLAEAVSGAPVVDLVLDHRFASGVGSARFTVPGITFVRDGLQPVDVSRLALGVIANVEGSVRGDGGLRWTPDGVTSSGSFSTDRLDLAAAFGPVERLSGTIRFDDLLALSTSPGQEVRLGSVNPGIEVIDGRVLYQLLPEQRVRIEQGVWPFSGGQLLLQPALLDFNADRPRRLTFDVSNVDAALFLQRYEFDNISATGIFDGVVPTIFDGNGGRVVGGSLVSRDGGGTLAYVGELSNRDLGFMVNLAYSALKSLRYDNLVVRLNGNIDGEMLTEVDFSGLAQGEGAEANFITRAVAKLPFTFRIRINAPFRQLLTSARGLYDPTDFIDQNLDSLLRAEREAEAARQAAATGDAAVQPSESEDQR